MASGLYAESTAVTFALLAIVVIVGSLTVLRWSITRGPSPWRTRALAIALIAGVLAIVSAVFDLRSIFLMARAPEPGVTITIEDMDQWWRVAYRRGSQSFMTANEIHVPIRSAVAMQWEGSPVIVWRASDFFPQELGGFRYIAERNEDLRVYRLWPPVRRHLQVIADRDFDRWFASQLQPARSDPSAEFLFESAGCAYCHVIRGVNEKPWKLAPELTHFGSRRTIAAIDLPNRRGYLAGWIVHSHALKRGSEMPENSVHADVLNGLLNYLESLR